MGWCEMVSLIKREVSILCVPANADVRLRARDIADVVQQVVREQVWAGGAVSCKVGEAREFECVGNESFGQNWASAIPGSWVQGDCCCDSAFGFVVFSKSNIGEVSCYNSRPFKDFECGAHFHADSWPGPE